MEKALPLEERSIGGIFQDTRERETYVIPIYQRNYAWREDEIEALVKDVHDSFKKNPGSSYYIGTLVTFRRGDNIYEVIDGQQRLTTAFILLKVLGEKVNNTLTYSARKLSEWTISHLNDLSSLTEEVDQGIVDGYNFAKKAVESGSIVPESELADFKKYFLDNVKIIHYRVPKDVDLNHYFEVMNSRGEQLEKHEIEKSLLCGFLGKSEDGAKDMSTFSRIWEACSEMGIYIQQAFPDETVFGSSLNSFKASSFDGIPKKDPSEGKKSIGDLLKESVGKAVDEDDKRKKDRFQTVIDFPNFLLVILKVTMMEYVDKGFDPVKFVLDDKELLQEFGKALETVGENAKAQFAKKFAFNLLKGKFFLDNYIVHHSLDSYEKPGDNPWKLQRYTKDGKSGYLKNLAEGALQEELVHLLSMFEVTFTPRQRKNYLFYCMMYLFGRSDADLGKETFATEYLEFLQKLSRKYFLDVYLSAKDINSRKQPNPNAFDGAILRGGGLNPEMSSDESQDYRSIFSEIYPLGCSDIPLYVFNYTDYLLWKKYADSLRGKRTNRGDKERDAFFGEIGCSDFGLEVFDSFYFSRTRKSLEHFFPQAKVGVENDLTAEVINCFGNFAMIGSEANSSGSNWDPSAKLKHYNDRKTDQVSVASLKFKIMMQKCQDDNEKWGKREMEDHQNAMLNVIFGKDAGNLKV